MGTIPTRTPDKTGELETGTESREDCEPTTGLERTAVSLQLCSTPPDSISRSCTANPHDITLATEMPVRKSGEAQCEMRQQLEYGVRQEDTTENNEAPPVSTIRCVCGRYVSPSNADISGKIGTKEENTTSVVLVTMKPKKTVATQTELDKRLTNKTISTKKQIKKRDGNDSQAKQTKWPVMIELLRQDLEQYWRKNAQYMTSYTSSISIVGTDSNLRHANTVAASCGNNANVTTATTSTLSDTNSNNNSIGGENSYLDPVDSKNDNNNGEENSKLDHGDNINDNNSSHKNNKNNNTKTKFNGNELVQTMPKVGESNEHANEKLTNGINLMPPRQKGQERRNKPKDVNTTPDSELTKKPRDRKQKHSNSIQLKTRLVHNEALRERRLRNAVIENILNRVKQQQGLPTSQGVTANGKGSATKRHAIVNGVAPCVGNRNNKRSQQHMAWDDVDPHALRYLPCEQEFGLRLAEYAQHYLPNKGYPRGSRYRQ